ncbi:MAG TPA: hypothetical protein VNK04_01855, partial [Gemmataceae bacterium]|nr:hypothetical protein [Gemmataceae bacterium]
MSSPLGRLSGRQAGGKRKLAGSLVLLSACCLLLGAFSLRAADPPPRPAAEPAKGDAAVQPAARDSDSPARPGLDGLKLPPNTVIVLCEEARDALRLVPKAFVVSLEEYQKQLDEIARLQKQAKPERPITPAVCRLSGRVEGDLAHLRAEFEFLTERCGTLVALGCLQGQPTAVSLDGRLPALQYTTDGYVLLVDEPGPHKAALELDLPVTSRGTGGNFRGLVLDLPRAPVTTLELDLPASVKEVRVGRTGTALATKPQEDKQRSRLETGGLGPLEQLDLTWKGPASRPVGPPLLTAEGKITVQVSESVVTTVAEITLDVLRGQATQWQLQVPPQAVVRVKTAGPEERAPATVEPANRQGTLHTVRLTEPSAEPLVVVVELEQPRGPGLLPVGPFHLVGAFRQRGTILVIAPPDLPLRFNPRAEVSPREVNPEEGRPLKAVAAFTYWNLPGPEKPPAPVPPLLTLEFETVKGVIGSRLEHRLSLGERGWEITTTVQVEPPPGGDVKELLIELPPGFELEDRRRPGEPVHDVQVRAAGREVVIKLTEKQVNPFTVTLEGGYPPPAAGTHQASLRLPRLKAERLLDRGGEVRVVLPADLELLPPAPGDAAREAGPREGHNRCTLLFDRMPARVDVAWRPHRPDLPVDAAIDLTLTAGNQVVVRHRLWAGGPQPLPAQLTLRVPEAAADTLRVTERGRLLPGPRDVTSRMVERTEPVTRANPLVLEYFFPLPAGEERGGPSRPFAIPLVVPEQATRGETRVRVWSDLGRLPVLAGGPWEEQPIEVVEGHDRLPDLCLRGARPDLPLALRLSESDLVPQAAVLVERALIRATVVQAGQYNYWASFRVSQLRAPHLDIELPAAPASLNLKVFLNGDLVQWHPVPDSAAGADAARLARLPIGPNLLGRPAVLDMIYQLTPNQPAARGSGYILGNVALQTTLYAPLLRRSGGHVPVRWDVRLPSDWVPLYAGGGFQFEQRWGWRGWLLAPQPAVSGAELEQWFAGDTSERSSPLSLETGETADRGTPSVACWRTDLEPLRLYHAPQQVWLLVCSLGLLAVGLGLYFVLVHRGLYGPIVLLLGAAAAVVGLLWPSVLAVVLYGCQPGLVVLLLVLGFHWLLQHRYRRQVVFLPGFTRLRKSGSSLIRA